MIAAAIALGHAVLLDRSGFREPHRCGWGGALALVWWTRQSIPFLAKTRRVGGGPTAGAGVVAAVRPAHLPRFPGHCQCPHRIGLWLPIAAAHNLSLPVNVPTPPSTPRAGHRHYISAVTTVLAYFCLASSRAVAWP